jgi:hypothetical protein
MWSKSGIRLLNMLGGTQALSRLLVRCQNVSKEWELMSRIHSQGRKGGLGNLIHLTVQVKGLFKGVTSPMVRSLRGNQVLDWYTGRYSICMSFTPLFQVNSDSCQINGVVFTSYAFFMRLQLPPRDSEGNDKEPSLGQICLAGAGSGMVGSYVSSLYRL